MSVKAFIDRPILSAMIAVSFVIIGIIALTSLPLEQYPDIAPPTVKVTATYTGAGVETMMKSVVAPLEASINGVENMQYMTSTAANNGTCTITIYFTRFRPKHGCCQRAKPCDLSPRPTPCRGHKGRHKRPQDAKLQPQVHHALQPRRPLRLQVPDQLSQNQCRAAIARIPGVGEVNVFGADYSLRIWLDPYKMSNYGLVPSDIDRVLEAQNLESPTGALGAESANTYQYTLKYRGRYSEVADYGNLVVKAAPDGQLLRLRDIADIELGTMNYNIRTTKGLPGASASITQIAGSNADAVVKQIDMVEEQVRKSLPANCCKNATGLNSLHFGVQPCVLSFLDYQPL